VTKADSNLLIYSSLTTSRARAAGDDPSPLAYNRLTTPRGGQYQLVLSDGTKVWLNAASSIHYPASFAGKERLVRITGEAYFDVAQDVSHPFMVETNGVKVEVLGTGFNVMAYRNEKSLQTTLVRGSVKVTQPGRHLSRILEPGEQVQIDNVDGSLKLVRHADLRVATAWKDGVQAFRNADIETIMREVERWYDVDVVYKGKVEQRAFSGEIPRNVSLAELLRLFEVNKIHFSIDAAKKRLTVFP
jgi:ferric-dicitrate binding protein FerR (iron transport regulator)